MKKAKKEHRKQTYRWRPNNRVTFQKWEDCARCGFPWPKKAIRVQRGIRVCPECYDDKDHQEYRAEHETSEPRDKETPWDPD